MIFVRTARWHRDEAAGLCTPRQVGAAAAGVPRRRAAGALGRRVAPSCARGVCLCVCLCVCLRRSPRPARLPLGRPARRSVRKEGQGGALCPLFLVSLFGIAAGLVFFFFVLGCSGGPEKDIGFSPTAYTAPRVWIVLASGLVWYDGVCNPKSLDGGPATGYRGGHQRLRRPPPPHMSCGRR